MDSLVSLDGHLIHNNHIVRAGWCSAIPDRIRPITIRVCGACLIAAACAGRAIINNPSSRKATIPRLKKNKACEEQKHVSSSLFSSFSPSISVKAVSGKAYSIWLKPPSLGRDFSLPRNGIGSYFVVILTILDGALVPKAFLAITR